MDTSVNIIYRNYNNQVDIYKILKFKHYCKKKGFKFFLSNNVKLAINLQLDGVYLPSFNKSFKHLTYRVKRNFQFIGSAHSLKEIRIKEKQGIKLIFLSSLFKKNKNYLGINKFKLITKLSKINFIALGGINNLNIKVLKLINVIGYAGISVFKKKGP